MFKNNPQKVQPIDFFKQKWKDLWKIVLCTVKAKKRAASYSSLVIFILLILPFRRLGFLFLSCIWVIGNWNLAQEPHSKLYQYNILHPTFGKDLVVFSETHQAVHNAICLNQYVSEMFVILGGDETRELEAVKYFLKHRNCFSHHARIFLSSGASSPNNFLEKTRINATDILFDNRAVDTLSNFTVLLHILKRLKLKNIAIATSWYHFPRALCIGTIVLGTSNIQFFPVSLEHLSNYELLHDESKWRLARDVLRAWFWVFTNVDSSSVVRFIKWIRHKFDSHHAKKFQTPLLKHNLMRKQRSIETTPLKFVLIAQE